MKLIVKKSLYPMRKSEFKKVLQTASKNVPHGIYGVLKDDIGELKNEVYNSAEELEKAVNEYKKGGFEVFYNGFWD
jgi:hypothetical protein